MNILDLIYPGNIYCIACERPLPAGATVALCERCVSETVWAAEPLCKKCGKFLTETSVGDICHDCGSTDHLFRKGYVCALYEGAAANIVRDMKYHDRPSYAEAAAALISARLRALAAGDIGGEVTGELPAWDLVLPVPMHRSKKDRRGYNQAELIARGVAKQMGLPLRADALLKTRDTTSMSGLTFDERSQNLRGTFCVKKSRAAELADKEILLIDDVYTTGSTADACAEVLLAAGARAVDIAVFASGADIHMTE